ncbi:myelin-associated oligodendrocyte basic protein [Wolffia australiana]
MAASSLLDTVSIPAAFNLSPPARNLPSGHSKNAISKPPRSCSRQFFALRASSPSSSRGFLEKGAKSEVGFLQAGGRRPNLPTGLSGNAVFSLPRSSSRQLFLLRASSRPNPPSSSSSSKGFTEKETKSEVGFLQAAGRMLEKLRKPAAAALLIGILLAVDPYGALAASGGRMGGRSFSSSSPSFSSSRSYSVSPGTSFSYSAPYYYAPSPFFGGGGGLYLGFGAGSGFFLLLMGFAAVILVSGFLSDRSDDGSVLTATEKTSVLKLQVGLLGLARSFQRDLDRIAESADTSTPEGLNYVLTETTLALLRHPDCCISGYSFVDVKRSVEDGEKRFNQLSIEERGKFDEETLVNVNSVKKKSFGSSRSSSFSNEYIVITILVAAEGVHKLPVINGSSNLREALQELASIPSDRLMAVEVLWTPQNEGDTLSERELLEDYPLLRPL